MNQNWSQLTRYNINHLSNLIVLFNDTVAKKGESKDTLQYYKDEVNKLISNQEISKEEAEIVYYAIGCENKDVISWDLAHKGLKTFTDIMNDILANCKTKDDVLQRVMEYNRSINSLGMNLIHKVFELMEYVNEKSKLKGQSIGFGTRAFTQPQVNEINEVDKVSGLKSLEENGYMIGVKSPHKQDKGCVTTINPTLLTKRESKQAIKVRNLIAEGGKVGIYQPLDICGDIDIIENKNLTKEFETVIKEIVKKYISEDKNRKKKSAITKPSVPRRQTIKNKDIKVELLERELKRLEGLDYKIRIKNKQNDWLECRPSYLINKQVEKSQSYRNLIINGADYKVGKWISHLGSVVWEDIEDAKIVLDYMNIRELLKKV